MSDIMKRTLDSSTRKEELLQQLLQQQDPSSSAPVIPLVAVSRDRHEPFPLSFAQQRLWLLEQLNPATPLYNMPLALRLSGPVDPDRLRYALGEVLRRHEALRTAFIEQGGVPFQQIVPASALSLPVLDLRHVSADSREREVQRYAREEAERPFDLTEGRLLRACLLHLAEEEFVFLLTLHHIAADAWSVEVLYREILAHYQAAREGRQAALPELTIQYVDYALWQRRWLQGEALERQLAYWKKQLEALPAVLPLPADRPRPAVQTFRGATHAFHLSPRLTAQLKALSQREGSTLFMTVLAAFQVWLARHSGLDDIAVGTPIANRSHPELEALIGFFLNTLVLRTRLSGNPSFRALLQQVKAMTLDAFNHRDVPFELVVEALQPERNLSYAPLFQVLFTLRTAAAAPAQSQNLDFRFQAFEAEQTLAKCDLSLDMVETSVYGKAMLSGKFEYNCDLFDAATIERFAQRFIALLEEIVSHPAQPIQQLNLLSEAEREQLLIDWHVESRAQPGELCFPQLFEIQAARTPAATALVYEDARLSYAELNARANQLAHYLRAAGVGPEVCVAVYMERGLDVVVTLLGILKAGGAYVPIDPTTPRERRTFILGEIQAPIMMSQEHLLPALAGETARVICLDRDREMLAREPAHDPVHTLTPRDMAYIIYTSGSTGQPKGVMIEHGSVANLIEALKRTVYTREQETPLRLGLNAALTFDVSVGQLVQLACGHTLHIIPQDVRFDPGAFVAYLQRHALQGFDCTPGQLRQLLLDGLSRQAVPTLEYVLVAGEAIDAALWQTLVQDGAGIYYNLYGPTEATVYATGCRIQAPLSGPIIGRPLLNLEAYVLDASLQPAPIGVPGELYIGGSGLARGYFKRPDLSDERFLPHPFDNRPGARLYRTGDQVRWLADGHLEYLGRLDHQVKIRGFRIELGEIEQRISQFPAIHECVVVAHQDQKGINQALVAYIVPRDKEQAETPLIQDLRAFLRQHLPDYMLPSFFEVLEALPLTTNGKVDRKALPAPSLGSRELRQYGPLPRNPLEETVAEIWQQVLGLDNLGVRADFFAVGGHSLLAMRVISRIRAVFQIELSLRRLFETPTIEGLAQVVAESLQEEQPLLEPPITARPADFAGAIPISFAQQRLWILDRLEPGSVVYHMPSALRLTGPLNRAALARSLSEVVARHDILRTSFPLLDDTPVQVIAPPVEAFPLPFTDLSHLPPEEREEAMQRLIAEEKRQPFHLDRGPLFRVHLIAMGEEEHVIFLTMHHIISDDWSMRIMGREVSLLYQAFVAGKDSPLAPLALQYADYAIWQRSWFQKEVLARQLSYWKTQLAGAPALLALPTDRPRGLLQNSPGGNYYFLIDQPLTQALQQLGQRTGATLYMTLLAAFQIFLMRYSDQDDIVVGTPIANRMHQEVEDLIGFFVNTLVLRTDLSGQPSFLEAIERVRKVVLEAMTHQDIPFEQVVEAIRPERDLNRSPLFQVMFQLHNSTPDQEVKLSQLTATEMGQDLEVVAFDLTLALVQIPQGLKAEFEYNADLFEHATIMRMAEHFLVLLRALTGAPEQSVWQLPLLSPAHYQQSVLDWNATGRQQPLEQLAYELVEERARLTPHASAVRAQGVEISYGELNRRANQLARYLRAQGAGAGSVVGVYLPRTLDMIVALYAIMKAGAAYLPFDSAMLPARVALISRDAEAALVITQEKLAERLTPGEIPLLCLDLLNQEISAQADSNLTKQITAEHPAYVIYTSGSTGLPKGVVIQHKALLRLIYWYHEAFAMSERDRSSQYANPGFDTAVSEIWPCLTRGGLLCLLDEEVRLAPAALLAWLAEQQITICDLPTPMAEILFTHEWPARMPLRYLIVGGDQLHHTPPEHLPCTLVNTYGPTENTVISTWAVIAPGQLAAGHLPTIGRPIANTQVYVLSSSGEPQPVGVPGELVLGGESLALGYLKRPALTAASFIPDRFSGRAGARLYRTGDVVRFLPDGQLEFLGRNDHQVKIRGFRVEPGEIEAHLLTCPGVHEAVVVVNEHQGEKRLVAYVTPQEGAHLSGETLQNWLRERLPDYMQPSALAILEELPQTPRGKVDRRELAARQLALRPAAELYTAPRDAIELQLVQLWEKLLGTGPIGVTENFFQLGGHSLAGVRLMSQIQRRFGVELPISTLFREGTIAAQAALLRQQEARIAFTPLVAIQPAGSRPPLFCVHPSGGEVLCFMHLARHLGQDQPVYGLRAPGPEQAESGTSLVAMAATYREALCALQPQGPYYLSGWSLGGVIAFEIARQLEAAGQQVAFLGLFDTYLPPAEADPDERLLMREFLSDLAGLSATAFVLDEAEIPAETEAAWRYLWQAAQQARLLPADVDLSYVKRLFAIFQRNLNALYRYRPAPYGGEISLFLASAFTGEQIEATHGWSQFAARVSPYAVPGDHYTMLRDPQVATLASLVQTCLEGQPPSIRDK